MHSRLNVDEIVRVIAYEPARRGWEADTVPMACCCKSLEDPVLDSL